MIFNLGEKKKEKKGKERKKTLWEIIVGGNCFGSPTRTHLKQPY